MSVGTGTCCTWTEAALDDVELNVARRAWTEANELFTWLITSASRKLRRSAAVRRASRGLEAALDDVTFSADCMEFGMVAGEFDICSWEGPGRAAVERGVAQMRGLLARLLAAKADVLLAIEVCPKEKLYRRPGPGHDSPPGDLLRSQPRSSQGPPCASPSWCALRAA